MSLTSKQLKNLNEYLEKFYSLKKGKEKISSQSKFFYINPTKEDWPVFLNIIHKPISGLVATSKNKKNDNYTVYSDSASFIFSTPQLNHLYKNLNLITSKVNEFNLFAKDYSSTKILTQELSIVLYEGEISNINKDFIPYLSLWVSVSINSKSLKIFHVKLQEDKIYLDHEEVTITDIENQINLNGVSAISGEFKHLSIHKNDYKTTEEIRNAFISVSKMNHLIDY
ncbi:MAG: hypothetical protein K2X69_06380 [Silvanigrellaceae bacterium]|nr:hypothetical protein [Silvanigrellaceae bacterium]